MFWGLSSTFSEHYQPRALVLKLHEPPTPFYTWVSMHTHAAFSYQFSHVWTINVDALISNPYYVCTSNLQRNPKNQKKKKPSVTPRVLYVVFLFLQLQSFSYNPIFQIVQHSTCMEMPVSFFFFFLYFTRNHKSRAERLEDKEERSGHDCLPHTCTTCVHTQRVQGPAGVTEWQMASAMLWLNQAAIW